MLQKSASIYYGVFENGNESDYGKRNISYSKNVLAFTAVLCKLISN